MIVVCGDFHGEFQIVNSFINKKTPSIILQCGDFGWWPRANGKDIGSIRRKIWNQYSLKNKETKIYWCPGNHEDWEELNKISKDKNEILPNVFYMERGRVMELPDGRKVLFMGGAYSIDRKYRVHRSGDFGWFEEETISQKDIYNLTDEKIDIVISHTAPIEFKVSHDIYNDKDDPLKKRVKLYSKKIQT